MTGAALELDRVAKRYGDVAALDDASILVHAGTVHAVLGENGAGKSTLMRVAFGLVRPDAGIVRVEGVERHFRSSADAVTAGLGMVHQHFSLVPAMTVAENVALGGRGRYDAARAAAVVHRVGAETGLTLDPAARVESLGVGAQQRVEIVKALSRDARLLILDEPTAVLAPGETIELLAWLRRFARSGRTAVIITHKLREVLDVADEITVLRRGRTVLALGRSEASEGALAQAMLGGPPQQHYAQELGVEHHPSNEPTTDTAPRTALPASNPSTNARPVALRATRLTVTDRAGVARLRDVSLDVHEGEMIGVAAVEGSGQRELLRVLAGRLAPSSGTVELPDEIGFVPEDRHRDALLLDFPLTANVALRGAGRRRGRMQWSRWADETRALLDAFDVRASGSDALARRLSGGNQQKLVLARELRGQVRVLVVENPTRGLDIRAAADVHRRLREARDAGTAVVVYSGDLDEVLLLADRVLVVHDGQVQETPRDRDLVGRAMLGA